MPRLYTGAHLSSRDWFERGLGSGHEMEANPGWFVASGLTEREEGRVVALSGCSPEEPPARWQRRKDPWRHAGDRAEEPASRKAKSHDLLSNWLARCLRRSVTNLEHARAQRPNISCDKKRLWAERQPSAPSLLLS